MDCEGRAEAVTPDDDVPYPGLQRPGGHCGHVLQRPGHSVGLQAWDGVSKSPVVKCDDIESLSAEHLVQPHPVLEAPVASLAVEVDDGGQVVTEYLGVTGPCVLSRPALSGDGPHPQMLLLAQEAQVVMSRVQDIEEFRMLKLI